MVATILRIDSHKPMLITALLATFTGHVSELAKFLSTLSNWAENSRQHRERDAVRLTQTCCVLQN